MRDPQNILEVANLLPDMMGFIFFPGSKRFVGADFSMPLHIPVTIQKTGVFVNETPGNVIFILRKYHLDAAQLHGKETPEDCKMIKEAGFKVLKAFGIDESFDPAETESFVRVTDYFVFDTKTPLFGGSGKKFNWKMLESFQLQHPFLLSGGISVEDADALKVFHHPQCRGYDVNSGFEIAPAMKDIPRLKQFFKLVK